jgi:hypothetical protein
VSQYYYQDDEPQVPAATISPIRAAVPLFYLEPIITAAAGPIPVFRSKRHPKATVLTFAANAAPSCTLASLGGLTYWSKSDLRLPFVTSRIERISSGFIALNRGHLEMRSKVTVVAQYEARREEDPTATREHTMSVSRRLKPL